MIYMGFQDIPKIETYQWYLDLVFSRAKKASGMVKTQTKGGRLEKVRAGEIARVQEIRRGLVKHLNLVLRSFPSLDTLTEFYNELVRATLDYPELKKSLGAMKWARDMIEKLSRQYQMKLKKCQHLRKISDYSSEYYGRISSVMRQIRNRLKYLDQARLVVRDFPSIKSGLFTVCLVGFPNVGKTTLLSKLTPSMPEIADYAFTTKKLNVGYTTMNRQKVQFIDTPGTLNREDKMNSVEKQAFLAMKYCADLIVFVFDVSDRTYDSKDQKKLKTVIKKFGKPLVVYLSKTDLVDADSFEKKDALTTIDEIKKEIKNQMASGL